MTCSPEVVLPIARRFSDRAPLGSLCTNSLRSVTRLTAHAANYAAPAAPSRYFMRRAAYAAALLAPPSPVLPRTEFKGSSSTDAITFSKTLNSSWKAASSA